jgi:protein-S-isoprenylcysteine O-methyltransferase Ste14
LISSFIIIVLAFGIYGIIHSLLASIKAKELAAAWMGTSGFRWYRLAYNIFAFIALLPVLALAVVLPDKLIYQVPAPWNYLLMILQTTGAVVALYAVVQTDLMFFSGLRQLMKKPTDTPIQNAMQSGGLYRYVRHPIYTGSLLFLWASPEMSWNSLALKTAFTLYFIFGAMVEEKKLVAEFGDAYRAYRLRTPMLIPGIKKHF